MEENQPVKRGRGRPKGTGKPIDIDEVEKLATIQCTDEEIACWFKMARETFSRNKTPEIQAAIDRGKANGRSSLRRAQYRAAMAGNATMLVWLGKQLLGQKDTVVNEHAGEITVNDGAKERLLGKLAGVIAASRDRESGQAVN